MGLMLIAILILFVGLITWITMTANQRDLLERFLELETALLRQIAQNSWLDIIKQIEAIRSYANRGARQTLTQKSNLLPSAQNLEALLNLAIHGFLEKKRNIDDVEDVLNLARRLASQRIYASPLNMALLNQRYDQLCELAIARIHTHGDVN